MSIKSYRTAGAFDSTRKTHVRVNFPRSRSQLVAIPLGIRKTPTPVRVNACMFGSRRRSKNDGQIYPCCKAFKVETDHACMQLALRSFVCPYPHPKLRFVSSKGKRADAQLRDTDNYCAAMGYMLARCTSSPHSLGTALRALDGESL